MTEPAATEPIATGPAGSVTELHLSQNDAADALLSRQPLALLIGMLLDQQVPMEKAFSGPYVIASRLGRRLDAADLAALDPAAFAELCSQTPAVHRFPGAMAARIQLLAAGVAADYGGRAEALWEGVDDADELRARLEALPGFGAYKARIFVALLGKQLGITPAGWREASDPYGEEGVFRSVADVTGPESLVAVRTFKKSQKAAAKTSGTSTTAASRRVSRPTA